MYKYTQFDTDFVRQRNAQFRTQIERRLNGSLTCLLYTSDAADE